jgi:hypothetical protein
MTYFLDFDRTLFDTDRFLPALLSDPAYGDVSQLSLSDIGAAIQTRFERGALSFKEGELRRYLFSDVADFVQSRDCVIVTAGPLAWQKAKVESALPGARALYAEGASDAPKGPLVRDAMRGLPGPFCFVDDTDLQLDSVKASCPDARLFRMERYGGAGDGAYPVVRSLAELPA